MENSEQTELTYKGTTGKDYYTYTFQNALRSEDDPSKAHAETKLAAVPINARKRHEQTSHIFTGEDDTNVKSSHKTCHYFPSKVMFNDGYIEKKNNQPNRKLNRFEIEERQKKNAKSLYTDEINPKRLNNSLLQKKIKDNYLSNPLKILTKEENNKINDANKQKNIVRIKKINEVLGSGGYKRTLGGNHVKTVREERDKVTNNDFHITQKSAVINKDKGQGVVPYYGKKSFAAASTGGKAFTYL